jgi:hypothetical protein
MNVHELTEKNGNYFIKYGTCSNPIVYIPVSELFVKLLKAKDYEVVIENDNGFIYTISYNSFIKCLKNRDEELKWLKNVYVGCNYELSIETFKIIQKRISMEHKPCLDTI